MRILIIDDEPLLAAALSHYLSTKGHNVVSANSAETVLSAMNPNIFSVIVTDFRMEPLDGIEAAKRIRAAGYDGKIVLMSGCCDLSIDDMGAVGIDSFLEKPFDVKMLSFLIEDLTCVKKDPLEYAPCVGF